MNAGHLIFHALRSVFYLNEVIPVSDFALLNTRATSHEFHDLEWRQQIMIVIWYSYLLLHTVA